MKSAPTDTQDPQAIEAQQRKVDNLVGKTATQGGEEREGARLHRLMGTLKNTHAALHDMHAKEIKAAELQLKAATERLKAARLKAEQEQEDFERRRSRMQAIMPEPCNDAASTANTNASQQSNLVLSPEVLVPIMHQAVIAIRHREGLGTAETVEMTAVNGFCQILAEHCDEFATGAGAHLAAGGPPGGAGFAASFSAPPQPQEQPQHPDTMQEDYEDLNLTEDEQTGRAQFPANW